MRNRRTPSSSSSEPVELFDFTSIISHVVSLIYTFTHREVRRYFLRLFLFHVRGATSLSDVRTVNGKVCASFGESYQRRSILADGDAWKRTLGAAFCSSFVPHSEVFATILAYFNLSSPSELWSEHETMFTINIRPSLRQHRHALQSEDDAPSYMWREVQNHFPTIHWMSLKDLGLPS